MNSILFVICPGWDTKAPPLGIAYLSRYLRDQGLSSMVWDVNIDIFNAASPKLRELWHLPKQWCWRDEEYFNTWIKPKLTHEIERIAQEIAEMNISVIGFTVVRSNVRFSIELAMAIKHRKPEVTIIFGGPSCMYYGERLLAPEELVDMHVIGEGEELLVDVLTHIHNGKDVKELSEYRVEGEKDNNVYMSQKPVLDLTKIPFPDFIEFDMQKYDVGAFPLVATRGCIRKCVFCNDWVVWKCFRARKAQDIFNEIVHHMNRYGIKEFEFVDLAVNGDERELEALCDLLIENDIGIRWLGNFIIRPEQNPRIFQKAHQAGCVIARFGLESGSDSILKKMNKPHTGVDARRILQMSYDAGLENHINIIVGFPGEGEREFKETLQFVEDNKDIIHRVSNVHPCYLTPGSVLEKEASAFGITLPEKDFSLHWYDAHGNTYERRKEKAAELQHLVQKLGLLFDEDLALILLDEELAKSKKNEEKQKK